MAGGAMASPAIIFGFEGNKFFELCLYDTLFYSIFLINSTKSQYMLQKIIMSAV